MNQRLIEFGFYTKCLLKQETCDSVHETHEEVTSDEHKVNYGATKVFTFMDKFS